MVFLETMAGMNALAGAMGNAWGYNRSLFEFDSDMAQDTAIQRQWARKEYVWLYREDIDNLNDLTTQKMSLYSTFVAIQLSFCGSMLCDASMISKWDAFSNRETGSVGFSYLFCICMATTTAFLMLALWFAIHTTVICTGCATCLQMQSRMLRDLPTGSEIDLSRKNLQDFEESGLSKQLRIPFIDRLARMKEAWSKGEDVFNMPTATNYYFTPDSLDHYGVNLNIEEMSRRRNVESQLREAKIKKAKELAKKGILPKDQGQVGEVNWFPDALPEGAISHDPSSISTGTNISTGRRDGALPGIPEDPTSSDLSPGGLEKFDSHRRIVPHDQSVAQLGALSQQSIDVRGRQTTPQRGVVAALDSTPDNGALLMNLRTDNPNMVPPGAASHVYGNVSQYGMSGSRPSGVGDTVVDDEHTLTAEGMLAQEQKIFARNIGLYENRRIKIQPIAKDARAGGAMNFVPTGAANQKDLKKPFIIRASHFDAYRGLQRHWIVYDAYGRVCMLLGTVYSLNMMAFWTVDKYSKNKYQIYWAPIAISLMLYCTANAIMKLDLCVNNVWHFIFDVPMFGLGVTLSILGCYETLYEGVLTYEESFLMEGIFCAILLAFQEMWFLVIFLITQPASEAQIRQQMNLAEQSGEKSLETAALLPLRVRSVAFMDVLSWKKSRQIVDHVDSQMTEKFNTGREIARQRDLALMNRPTMVAHDLVQESRANVWHTKQGLVTDELGRRRMNTEYEEGTRGGYDRDGNYIPAVYDPGRKSKPGIVGQIGKELKKLVTGIGGKTRTEGRSSSDDEVHVQEFGADYSLVHHAIIQSIKEKRPVSNKEIVGNILANRASANWPMVTSTGPVPGITAGQHRPGDGSIMSKQIPHDQDGSDDRRSRIKTHDSIYVASVPPKGDPVQAGAGKGGTAAMSPEAVDSLRMTLRDLHTTKAGHGPTDFLHKNHMLKNLAGSRQADRGSVRLGMALKVAGQVNRAPGQFKRVKDVVSQVGSPKQLGAASTSSNSRADDRLGVSPREMLTFDQEMHLVGVKLRDAPDDAFDDVLMHDATHDRAFHHELHPLQTGHTHLVGDHENFAPEFPEEEFRRFVETQLLGRSYFSGPMRSHSIVTAGGIAETGIYADNPANRAMFPSAAGQKQLQQQGLTTNTSKIRTQTTRELLGDDEVNSVDANLRSRQGLQSPGSASPGSASPGSVSPGSVPRQLSPLDAHGKSSFQPMPIMVDYESHLREVSEQFKALEMFTGLIRCNVLRKFDELHYWIWLYSRFAPDNMNGLLWRDQHDRIRKSEEFHNVNSLDLGTLWEYDISEKRFVECGYFDEITGLYYIGYQRCDGEMEYDLDWELYGKYVVREKDIISGIKELELEMLDANHQIMILHDYYEELSQELVVLEREQKAIENLASGASEFSSSASAGDRDRDAGSLSGGGARKRSTVINGRRESQILHHVSGDSNNSNLHLVVNSQVNRGLLGSKAGRKQSKQLKGLYEGHHGYMGKYGKHFEDDDDTPSHKKKLRFTEKASFKEAKEKDDDVGEAAELSFEEIIDEAQSSTKRPKFETAKEAMLLPHRLYNAVTIMMMSVTAMLFLEVLIWRLFFKKNDWRLIAQSRPIRFESIGDYVISLKGIEQKERYTAHTSLGTFKYTAFIPEATSLSGAESCETGSCNDNICDCHGVGGRSCDALRCNGKVSHPDAKSVRMLAENNFHLENNIYVAVEDRLQDGADENADERALAEISALAESSGHPVELMLSGGTRIEQSFSEQSRKRETFIEEKRKEPFKGRDKNGNSNGSLKSCIAEPGKDGSCVGESDKKPYQNARSFVRTINNKAREFDPNEPPETDFEPNTSKLGRETFRLPETDYTLIMTEDQTDFLRNQLDGLLHVGCHRRCKTIALATQYMVFAAEPIYRLDDDLADDPHRGIGSFVQQTVQQSSTDTADAKPAADTAGTKPAADTAGAKAAGGTKPATGTKPAADKPVADGTPERERSLPNENDKQPLRSYICESPDEVVGVTLDGDCNVWYVTKTGGLRLCIPDELSNFSQELIDDFDEIYASQTVLRPEDMMLDRLQSIPAYGDDTHHQLDHIYPGGVFTMMKPFATPISGLFPHPESDQDLLVGHAPPARIKDDEYREFKNESILTWLRVHPMRKEIAAQKYSSQITDRWPSMKLASERMQRRFAWEQSYREVTAGKEAGPTTKAEMGIPLWKASYSERAFKEVMAKHRAETATWQRGRNALELIAKAKKDAAYALPPNSKEKMDSAAADAALQHHDKKRPVRPNVYKYVNLLKRQHKNELMPPEAEKTAWPALREIVDRMFLNVRPYTSYLTKVLHFDRIVNPVQSVQYLAHNYRAVDDTQRYLLVGDLQRTFFYKGGILVNARYNKHWSSVCAPTAEELLFVDSMDTTQGFLRVTTWKELGMQEF